MIPILGKSFPFFSSLKKNGLIYPKKTETPGFHSNLFLGIKPQKSISASIPFAEFA
jgi:hypothetical protein